MQNRIVIEDIKPSFSPNGLASKGSVGENIEISAIVICDGHESLNSNLLFKHEKERRWQKVPLSSIGNDTWVTHIRPSTIGEYLFTFEADVDEWKNCKEGLLLKLNADVLEKIDIENALSYLESCLPQLSRVGARILNEQMNLLQVYMSHPQNKDLANILKHQKIDKVLTGLKSPFYFRCPTIYKIRIEPKLAQMGAWYEFFPRSNFSKKDLHGTFRTAETMLEYVAELGFDVVYLPPIHPVGSRNRKGKNNKLQSGADDVGSPWAIGNSEGGHKSINPELGTLHDFLKFNKKAEQLGLKIALDIAFQCSPDHPYIKEHPEWFKKRADGSIQYAENPPKKYEDIYPFDFFCEDRENLWLELKSIFDFWIENGITIFRVDNPHTKPFSFWQWLIQEIKQKYPEVIFLAEAFTRPHVMYYLAKIGFSQSYTYFTWRTTKNEIETYLKELTNAECAAFFRPNFWPNTPDILSGRLRDGHRNDFRIRFILASTLSSNYGIYGPAFELCVSAPRDGESEEYLNSEKYELKNWNIYDEKSLSPLIKKINKIRKQNSVFSNLKNLRFHPTENENLIAYSNFTHEEGFLILTIVNLSSTDKQEGLLHFGQNQHGYSSNDEFEVEDLLNDKVFSWQGETHYIALDPHETCAHLLRMTIPHIKKLSGVS
jgi:starch synthase (maltosyl-transferring)